MKNMQKKREEISQGKNTYIYILYICFVFVCFLVVSFVQGQKNVLQKYCKSVSASMLQQFNVYTVYVYKSQSKLFVN